MEIYVPDIYQENIYKINYKTLSSRGIKCLLFDLDNTLVLIRESLPGEECKKLFSDLKKKGFKILITSNSIKARVKPIAEELKVDYISSCKKPNIDKINEYIKNSKFGLDEIAIIGDSMMDDVVCGNTIGITTVLLDQMSRMEFPIAKIKRIKEKRIQKKLRDKNLFTKGRYYV
ncbi:MAG: YqeG family HAD IIIA-type phosphatase [Bacilli bacterium]|nr:YqeG family HAD IIIA-type phosphatase [Bacilli bacterium]